MKVRSMKRVIGICVCLFVVGCAGGSSSGGSDESGEDRDVSVTEGGESAGETGETAETGKDAETGDDGSPEIPEGQNCAMETNAGCSAEKVCCDFGGIYNCVLPDDCQSSPEVLTCFNDTECDAGKECCKVQGLNYSECVDVGTCPDNVGTGGGAGCGPGDCAGAYVCCATGAGTDCLLQTSCTEEGGVMVCDATSDCMGGFECCDLGSVMGCVPGGACGGSGGTSGGGSGGGVASCTADVDCGAGEECCDPLGLGLGGTCVPQGTCGAGGSGGGGLGCAADADCGGGSQVCCDLMGVGLAFCLDQSLCPTGGGSGGGTGGGGAICTSDGDCSGTEICCDPIGLGLGGTCSEPADCGGGSGGGSGGGIGGDCSSWWDCGGDNVCCDSFLGTTCTPEMLCGLGGSEVGPKTACADESACGSGDACCDPLSEGQTFCAPKDLCPVDEEEGSCTGPSDCSGGQECCKGADGESSCADACGEDPETGGEAETGEEEETGGEAEGACTNPADTTILDGLGDAGLTEIGTSCGPGCFLSGDKAGCFGGCYADAGLSAECSACFGEIGACSMENCLDGFSADEACIEAVCQPAFDVCSGL